MTKSVKWSLIFIIFFMVMTTVSFATDIDMNLGGNTATNQTTTNEIATNTETDGSQSSTTMQYQKSRAVKESYTARLRKVEFEEKMGTIVHKEGIEKASFGVARILREKLKAVPNRLAPKVTVVTDQRENFIILQEEMESVIKEIQAAIVEIINT